MHYPQTTQLAHGVGVGVGVGGDDTDGYRAGFAQLVHPAGGPTTPTQGTEDTAAR